MTFRYLAAWIAMIGIGIANGVLRELTYGAYLPENVAHQVSTVIALVLFGVYIWWISRIWNFNSGRQALTVGVVWLLMTVAFEFGFGHWVAGHTWNELLYDYNLAAGRLWVLVPLWIATAPWVFCRLRQRARN